MVQRPRATERYGVQQLVCINGCANLAFVDIETMDGEKENKEENNQSITCRRFAAKFTCFNRAGIR